MNRGGYAPRGQNFQPRGGQQGYAPRGQQGYAPRGQQSYAPRQSYPRVQAPSASTAPFDQCLEKTIPSAAEELIINSYNLVLPSRRIWQYDLRFFADYRRLDQQQGNAQEEQEDKFLDDLSANDDKNVLQSIRRQCITNLYELLFQQHGAYFGADKKTQDDKYEHVYAYDRKSMFFCSLEMGPRVEENSFEINFAGMTPEEFGRLRNPTRVYATLKHVAFLDPENPPRASDMEQFLDILLSQHQLDTPARYVKFGPKVFDLSTGKDIEYACELKNGHQKSVHVSEKKAELQIDAKISPFHQAMPLLHYVNARWELEPNDDWCSDRAHRCLQQLKGLYVRTIHKPHNEVFRIHGVTSVPATDQMFGRDGQQISVAAYCQNAFPNFLLAYPHFPCAIKKFGAKELHYPLEVLKVVDAQKFSKDDMNKKQEANMIKDAQRRPDALMGEIGNQKKLASIHDNDQYVAAARVSIGTQMNSITSEVLSAPMITFKGNAGKQPVSALWDIKDVEFIKPAFINAMAIFYNGIPEHVAMEAANKIEQQARRLGMTMTWQLFPLADNQLSFEYLEPIIRSYRDQYGVDFVMAFASGSEFHHMLKATEVTTRVPTQQVEPRTISNPKLGNVTIGNIIQKMNLKNGGYNQYFQQVPSSGGIDLFQSFLKTTMVLGFYVSHPSPGSNEDVPSVVGYSFTTNHRGNVNRGGFVYKRARIPNSSNFEATLSDADLRKPIEESTKLYYEENKCYPERVLVYRFGASQGEIEKIQSEECPRIVYGFKSASGQMPKVTVVAVRRHHNTRIFKQPQLIDPNAKAPDQNVTPGSCVRGNAVIDSVMVPHRALQGTAKPTIFSTIFPSGKDNDLSENFLKNITHAFCYMHEIVNTAISVPHTLRSAEQMANRGTKLWHSKSHDLAPGDEDFSQATTALNPQIKTRYWA